MSLNLVGRQGERFGVVGSLQTVSMAKTPRRPSAQTRKNNSVAERAAGSAIVAAPGDPRQAGLFDVALPKWIRPCLPTLVDKPPVGAEWVHEVNWDGYRVSIYVADSKATIRTCNGRD